MNKAALFENTPAWQVLLGSGLVGAGGYGSLRLVQELMEKKKKEELMNSQSGLSVDIPAAPGIAKQADVGENLLKTFAMITGVPVGFIGADAMYRKFKENELQKNIDAQNNQRLQLLGQFKTGEATDTPNIDALCDGIIGIIEKQADTTQDVLDAQDRAQAGASDAAVQQSMPLHNSLGTAGLLMALMAAGYTGGTMMQARKAREDSEAKKRYPTQIGLNQVPIQSTPPLQQIGEPGM